MSFVVKIFITINITLFPTEYLQWNLFSIADIISQTFVHFVKSDSGSRMQVTSMRFKRLHLFFLIGLIFLLWNFVTFYTLSNRNTGSVSSCFYCFVLLIIFLYNLNPIKNSFDIRKSTENT